MTKMKWVALIIAFGCFVGNAQAFGFGDDFQGRVCHVSDAAGAKNCNNGDVLLYRPNIFGNEQLPLLIVAAFCDFGHPIVYNTGGVTCIFTDKRKSDWPAFGVK